MRACTLLLLAVPLTAQTATLTNLEGELLEWEGSAKSGAFTFRIQDLHVQVCRFGEGTQFERNGQPASLQGAKPGDRVEITAEQTGTGLSCLARTVRLVDAQPIARSAPTASSLSRYGRSPLSNLDFLAPRGNLTFTGVVSRISPNMVTVRTRTDGQRTFLLRQDTRFLADGVSVDASTLAVNTRVFIRAGKNLDDQIEVYQVIWGKILQAE
jgi:hypothetical protein